MPQQPRAVPPGQAQTRPCPPRPPGLASPSSVIRMWSCSTASLASRGEFVQGKRPLYCWKQKSTSPLHYGLVSFHPLRTQVAGPGAKLVFHPQPPAASAVVDLGLADAGSAPCSPRPGHQLCTRVTVLPPSLPGSPGRVTNATSARPASILGLPRPRPQGPCTLPPLKQHPGRPGHFHQFMAPSLAQKWGPSHFLSVLWDHFPYKSILVWVLGGPSPRNSQLRGTAGDATALPPTCSVHSFQGVCCSNATSCQSFLLYFPYVFILLYFLGDFLNLLFHFWSPSVVMFLTPKSSAVLPERSCLMATCSAVPPQLPEGLLTPSLSCPLPTGPRLFTGLLLLSETLLTGTHLGLLLLLGGHTWPSGGGQLHLWRPSSSPARPQGPRNSTSEDLQACTRSCPWPGASVLSWTGALPTVATDPLLVLAGPPRQQEGPFSSPTAGRTAVCGEEHPPCHEDVPQWACAAETHWLHARRKTSRSE